MKVVDANALLYAVNEDSVHHEASRRWLDAALGGADSVGFSWIVLTAFVRLSTKIGLMPQPLGVSQAMDVVDAWIDAPGSHVVQPGADHARILRELLEATGTGGNLVSDAHLAAIARERRATVVTYDADFTRFAGVASSRPDDLL